MRRRGWRFSKFPDACLRKNPLHDPVARQAAVFLPDEYDASQSLPVVYWLPGWGGSSEKFIKSPAPWQAFVQTLASNVTPVVFVVVDAKTRWGGSQYLNSPAQGNYADYICDEIVPLVESRYRVAKDPRNRIIAGHSSGGFGALRLGMMRPKLFGAVIALAPDSIFPISHLPLMQAPKVAAFSLRQIEALYEPGAMLPSEHDVIYGIGLSAAYAPSGRFKPGRFDWLYDENGNFRPKVWQRWVDNDPLTLVQKHRDAFHPNQKIYLDGGTADRYKANIGARAIYEVLQERKSPCAFYEMPGGHSDHTPERIERGLAWVFGKPLLEVTTNGIVRLPQQR